MKVMNAEQTLKQEFNRWAEEGRGEEMENHHWPITRPVLPLMELKDGDCVLDLGCGSGWATRKLAELVAPTGTAVGIDVSDEMIARARKDSGRIANVRFEIAAAHEIPAGSNWFTKVLSIESFYYYPDQDAALQELFRVMAPAGRLFILINLYKDNPYSLR